MDPHSLPNDDNNYRLEVYIRGSLKGWILAHPPNKAASLEEARLLFLKGNGGTRGPTRVEPSAYRIVDARSGRVYEATGDLPKVQSDTVASVAAEATRAGNTAIAASIPTEVIGGAFATKTSGVRESIGNMVRSPSEGKTNFTLILRGPMFQRWAELLTRGAVVYGADNWLEGLREADPAKRKAIKQRYLESGSRHYVQWIHGDRDEDHAAAVFFNINGYEAMVWTDDIVTRKERLAEIERLVS